MESQSNTDTSEKQSQHHPFGTINEASECNILRTTPAGKLLIAPFHDHRYTYNILFWNPHTLKLLARFPSDRIFELWDDLCAAFQKDLIYVENIWLYKIESKGVKKMKNIFLDMDYNFTKIRNIIGHKKLKKIYIFEDLWVGIVSIYSEERETWASEDVILKAFIHENLGFLVICTEDRIIIHGLDEQGNVETENLFEVPLKYAFATAAMDKDSDELIVISVSEKEGEDESSIFVSRFKLSESGIECVQEEKLLKTLTYNEYDCEISQDQKALICMSDHEPLEIFSIETGEEIFKKEIVGKFFKYDSKNGKIFTSSYTGLHKISIVQ